MIDKIVKYPVIKSKNKFLKFYFILFLSLMIHGKTFSQIQVGLNAGPSLPISTFKNAVGMGAGFDIFLQNFYPEKRLAFGIKTGYNIFNSRSLVFNEKPVRYNFFPATLLVKYYLSERIVQPYAELDAGIILYRIRRSIGVTNMMNNNFLNYLLAPVFGVDYNISDVLSISINGKYNLMISSTSSSANRLLSFANITLGIFYKY